MPSNEDRSVSDVLRDILGNLQDIVRSEVRLAKAEFKTEAGHAIRAAKPLITGVVLALYAGGLLLLALVLGLTLVLPSWMAALSVGVLVALLAAILIGMGWARLRNVNPKPKKNYRDHEGGCPMAERPDQIARYIESPKRTRKQFARAGGS